jgi:hypothetical protein
MGIKRNEKGNVTVKTLLINSSIDLIVSIVKKSDSSFIIITAFDQ